MSKIRLDTSTLHIKHQSGVAAYTRLLEEALESSPDIQLATIKKPFPSFRIYNKAHSYGLALPIDMFLPAVDLTIFPNFSVWPTWRSKQTAVVIHDLTYLYFPEAVENKNLAHLRRVVPRAVRKADYIITVSNTVKEELIKELSVPLHKCITTPIPPDKIFFGNIDSTSIQKVKEKYGIEKKYIYFIGNLEPRKNLKTLIEAYRLLPKDIKQEYCLVLAGGKGWKTKETEQVLKEALDAGEDIKHLGYIDQTDSPALYHGAHLFVMPSFYEGFGVPILEAMASGTPVVASDIPVFREVGSTYATYADPYSPPSFARAISQALQSPHPSRDQLLENVHRYSWQDNINTIITTIQG